MKDLIEKIKETDFHFVGIDLFVYGKQYIMQPIVRSKSKKFSGTRSLNFLKHADITDRNLFIINLKDCLNSCFDYDDNFVGLEDISQNTSSQWKTFIKNYKKAKDNKPYYFAITYNNSWICDGKDLSRKFCLMENKPLTKACNEWSGDIVAEFFMNDFEANIYDEVLKNLNIK